MSLGFSFSSSTGGILCAGGWWQLVVCPLPSHIVALYHLAAQKLELRGSNTSWRKSRSFIDVFVYELGKSIGKLFAYR